MLPVATMVDSRNDEAMRDRIDRIEKKIDDLAASVDWRFEAVDRRFDAVEAEFISIAGAFAEQRQYTEFAFGRLEAKMDAGFARADVNFARLERKLDQFMKAFAAPKRGRRRG